jgi:small subunit ribosomal protein S15
MGLAALMLVGVYGAGGLAHHDGSEEPSGHDAAVVAFHPGVAGIKTRGGVRSATRDPVSVGMNDGQGFGGDEATTSQGAFVGMNAGEGFGGDEVFATAEGAPELAPLPSYFNHQTVEVAREKWKTHDTDTGSVQVQVAVLTARIAYMTKHMQDNKKDYASLRGLTAMVTRRRKLLQYLLTEDLAEFKRITAELGIRTNQLLKPKVAGARGRRDPILSNGR